MAKKKALKRLTLDQILAAKEQKEKDRLQVKEIEIPSMGGTLLFKRPSDEVIFEFVDAIKDDDSMANTCAQYGHVIYVCCDELKDPKLHDAVGISDPDSPYSGDPEEIVEAVMEASDIAIVGDAVCSMNRLYRDAESEVKNG